MMVRVMKKTLLLALLLANASATAKVTGAKWALYDRHIPAYSHADDRRRSFSDYRDEHGENLRPAQRRAVA
jgi:hypothetical protein